MLLAIRLVILGQRVHDFPIVGADARQRIGPRVLDSTETQGTFRLKSVCSGNMAAMVLKVEL
jgi:hypothetical protein